MSPYFLIGLKPFPGMDVFEGIAVLYNKVSCIVHQEETIWMDTKDVDKYCEKIDACYKNAYKVINSLILYSK